MTNIEKGKKILELMDELTTNDIDYDTFVEKRNAGIELVMRTIIGEWEVFILADDSVYCELNW